jgi:hypothetical protein
MKILEILSKFFPEVLNEEMSPDVYGQLGG